MAKARVALDEIANARPLVAGMHNQRLGIAIASGLGMLATFLPWVHVPIFGAVTGTAGDGWITLALFVPAMVLVFRGNKMQPINAGVRLGAVIPAGIAGLIGMSKIARLKESMDDAGRGNRFAEALAGSVQVGIGIYLLIFAAIALVAVAWLLAKPAAELTAD